MGFRFLALLLDVDGLWRSLGFILLFVILTISGTAVIVGGKDWSWQVSGMILLILGLAGVWYYGRLVRRLIREFRESEEDEESTE